MFTAMIRLSLGRGRGVVCLGRAENTDLPRIYRTALCLEGFYYIDISRQSSIRFRVHYAVNASMLPPFITFRPQIVIMG